MIDILQSLPDNSTLSVLSVLESIDTFLAGRNRIDSLLLPIVASTDTTGWGVGAITSGKPASPFSLETNYLSGSGGLNHFRLTSVVVCRGLLQARGRGLYLLGGAVNPILLTQAAGTIQRA